MAQTKILIDTNSYLRLAQNLHPLLCQSFGSCAYTIYAHADLNDELKGNRRIKGKFTWFSEEKFKEARIRSVQLSRQNKQDIEDFRAHMWDYVMEEQYAKYGKGASPVDVLILATALALGIKVVTDDQDMIEVAQEFEVDFLSSLALLKLMLDEDHIEMEKVIQVTEQWQYDNDTPYKAWKQEYRKLFDQPPQIIDS
ncbi:PIN domain-containing protein [Rubritalea tangerina]|uniref:PIN domain-containing protein n=1 Tax=Rubritalea tangerina TaxID=430798 RepID=A0ABW4ZD78_9BACT